MESDASAATRVNIDNPEEVAFWCRRWGVTEDRLRAAVLKCGPMIIHVGAELTRVTPQPQP